MTSGDGFPQMLDVALSADQPFDLLILLVLGHFLADFPLQSDRMAVEKCPGKRCRIGLALVVGSAYRHTWLGGGCADGSSDPGAG